MRRPLPSLGLLLALTAARPALADDPDPPPRKSLVPPISLAVLAAGSLGAGIALTVASASKRAEALDIDRSITASGGSCISAAPDARCADLMSAAQKVDTLHNLAIGSYVGAGLFAASVALYILWPMPEESGVSLSTRSTGPTAPTLKVAPSVGRGQGGLVVYGAF